MTGFIRFWIAAILVGFTASAIAEIVAWHRKKSGTGCAEGKQPSLARAIVIAILSMAGLGYLLWLVV